MIALRWRRSSPREIGSRDGERQDCRDAPSGHPDAPRMLDSRGPRSRGRSCSVHCSESAHWIGHVLYGLVAEVLPGEGELGFDLFVDATGDADATGFCQSLQAGRNIHAITNKIIILCDHVAEIDADAELH